MIEFTTASDWAASSARWLDGSTPLSPMHGVQLRAAFDLRAADAAHIRRARLSVAALAYYKCWINGQIVSDHELGHFTTFEQRVLFDTFDVTELLLPHIASGSAPASASTSATMSISSPSASTGSFEVNAVGCALGSGWDGMRFVDGTLVPSCAVLYVALSWSEKL